ncbi:hypothetical protein GGP92_001392 [Salinibacter ruber]|nr:hypothetical protein [Salinibacter ruber]
MTCLFLVPDYQTTPLFHVADAALDGIPITVFLIVASRRASRSFSEAFAGRNR